MINYVPHVVHALQPDKNGDLPWRIGRAKQIVKDGELAVEVTEVFGKDITELLESIKKAPDARVAVKQLHLIGPRVSWPAEVRNRNADGTLDLDIVCSTAVTLHYDRVPQGGPSIPHTWYET